MFAIFLEMKLMIFLSVKEWKKMETALVENVLPTVQSLSLDSDPPFQIADIAACFTLASFSSCGEYFTQLFN